MEQDSTTLLFKVNSELMAVKRIWFSTGMQDVESPLKFGMVDNASINDHERDFHECKRTFLYKNPRKYKPTTQYNLSQG